MVYFNEILPQKWSWKDQFISRIKLYPLVSIIWLTTPGTFDIFLFYTFPVWDIAHVTLLTESCKISYSLGVYLVCLKIGAFLNFLTLTFSACLCQSHNFLPQFWYEIRTALIKTFQMVYHIWPLGFYLRVWKKRHKNSGVKGLIFSIFITWWLKVRST